MLFTVDHMLNLIFAQMDLQRCNCFTLSRKVQKQSHYLIAVAVVNAACTPF